MTDIIERLRARRYEIGLTLRQLAEKSGYNDNTIWQWETGRTAPSFRSLHDWTQALGGVVKVEFPDAS